MLYIEPNNTETIKALNTHWQFFSCRIIKKLSGAYCLNKDCKICKTTDKRYQKNQSKYFNKIVHFLLKDDNLKKIICGNPIEIEETNNAFFQECFSISNYSDLDNYFSLDEENKKKQDVHELILEINSVFNYKYFIELEPAENDYSAYHLAGNLNRRSCTYCNRTYTTTMKTKEGRKLMRPHFDHWYPKSKYPLLALSFYNLIPSCTICNSSSKGDLILNLTEHSHPYIHINQSNEFSFNYFFNKKLNQQVIHVINNSDDSKVCKTLKLLKIDDMYNTHLEELNDLIKVKQAYSESYLEKMRFFFPKIKMSDNEVYRLLFGTELGYEDFHKRPLSKFKSDILKELKIIK